MNPIIRIGSIYKLCDRLKTFYELYENWNGSNTYAPTEISMQYAVKVIEKYEKFVTANKLIAKIDIWLCPISSGGIRLDIMYDEFSLEIDIRNNKNTVGYLYTNDKDIQEESSIKKLEFIDIIFNKLLVRLYKIDKELKDNEYRNK